MDLTNITTPAQLLELNKQQKSELEQAVELLKNCDYQESRKVVEWLLNNMLDWHRTEACEKVMGEEPGSALQWADDAGKFAAILSILETIS